MLAAGQIGVVERRGHKVALGEILRAGHDLDGRFFSDVDRTYPQLVRVGMMRHLDNLAEHYVADLGALVNYLFHLKAGGDEPVRKLLHRDVDVDEIFEPTHRNFHISPHLKLLKKRASFSNKMRMSGMPYLIIVILSMPMPNA